jgi:hypothetical protein
VTFRVIWKNVERNAHILSLRESIHIPKRAVSINHRVIHSFHSPIAVPKDREKSHLAGPGFYGNRLSRECSMNNFMSACACANATQKTKNHISKKSCHPAESMM